MQFAVIQRILGLLLALFSITLLPPIVIAAWVQDGAVFAFIMALLITVTLGLVLWLPVRNVKKELRLRDGFVVVVLFWAGLGLTAAVPLVLADNPHMSFTDAAFESLSALTTTGATVITGIDTLPLSILFYLLLKALLL